VATQAEIRQFQTELQAVSTLAVADLVRELRDITGMSPARAAAVVREVVPVIVAENGELAGAVAADFYDELRFLAVGAGATAFTATIAPDYVPDELVAEALAWALAPLFDDKHDPQDALVRLADKTQTLVLGGGRRTIEHNAAGDPVGTRYARHAQPDACAFCRMLATRGTVLPDGTVLGTLFLTPESAERVTGDVNEDGQMVRGPRGTQALGETYHDNCRCTAVPVFPGDTYEPAAYIGQFQQEYLTAAAVGTTRADVSKLLANWRDLYGTR
jgi:hypothetical protein